MNDDLIKQFANRISDEQDFLNGLKIYYKLIPAAIRWTNSGSIKRISGRMTAAINQANLLLNKHKNGVDVSQQIQQFRWPERWGPIESRVSTVQVAWIASGVVEEDPDKMSKADIKKIKEKVGQFL